MASSDDEEEPVPRTVSNYHFVNNKHKSVSFALLPVQWNDKDESPSGKRKQIFLHGNADNGFKKIYKEVTAWKFDLSDAKPEIWVLSKENKWIKLQKPRQSFKNTVRTILITVHCLHFVKKNPETSGGSLWNHLSKLFSIYKTPSERDLLDHSTLISEAVKRDKSLAKLKFLVTCLEQKPRKRKVVDEVVGTTAKPGNVVDDDEMMNDAQEDDSDEESSLFDSVCAICDNGGDLLCCEGGCMRSFHATVKAGSEAMCKSLGLSAEQVKAVQKFFCKNCQYKQHQCFSCGELASSDKSSGAEVFRCVSATCGRFYHPHCVAKLLRCEGKTDAEELQKKIAAGKSFTCPIHKCHVCKQGENKTDPDLQFAVCRRCPMSYHRKCLPRKISFEDLEDEGIETRAWEGLLPDRILIYCLKHDVDDESNHIKFPKIAEKKRNQASPLLSSRKKLASSLRRSRKSVVTCNNGERDGDENLDQGKNRSGEKAEKRQRAEGKHGKGSGDVTPKEKQNARRSPKSRMDKGMSHHSPTKVTSDKSLDANQSNVLEPSLQTEVDKEGSRHPNHHLSTEPGTLSQMEHGGTQEDDLAKRSSSNSQETHLDVLQVSGASRDHEVKNSPGYRSYNGKTDEKFGSEADMMLQVQPYGQQDNGFSSRDEHLDSAAASSYKRMSTSSMQIDAHTRMDNSRFEPPPLSRNGTSRPGFQAADTFGFALGPCPFLSPNNTAGWIED